jgi:beta-glucosidase
MKNTKQPNPRRKNGLFRGSLYMKNAILSLILCLLPLSIVWSALADLPYKDASLPVEERVDDLIGRMNLQEKAAQLTGWWNPNESKLRQQGKIFTPEFYAGIAPNGLGEVGSINLSIEEDIRQYQVMQDYFLNNTRLGIPVIRHGECAHGFMRFEATSFPAAIGLACSWNPELVEAVYDHIGQEAASRGVPHMLSPVIDVTHDLRWGRVDETMGEDPFLVARLGAAMIRGLQGSSDGTIDNMHVAATLKHFAGYAASAGGLNKAPYPYSKRRLMDTEIYPFKYVIRETKPASIMAAYQAIDGIPCHTNKWLLTDVLRGQLGFEGLVVADYDGITFGNQHLKVGTGDRRAAREAFNAGCQLELPGANAYQHLPALVRQNQVTPELLDEAVRAVLKLKFKVGAFENRPLSVKAATALTTAPETRALARQAARESMVLLKNDGGLLPLDSSKKQTVAIIGPNADFCGLGSYSGIPNETVTLLEGMKNFLGDDSSLISHAQGSVIAHNQSNISYENWRVVNQADFATLEQNEALIQEAVKVAKQADVVILALGENVLLGRESWSNNHLGDRTTLDLTEPQQELARRILALNKPVVLYLMHGKPLGPANLIEQFSSILTGHYSGQETGAAAAELIYGAAVPSGKLTVTWPRSIAHQPAHYNRPTGMEIWPYLDASLKPLFPFGHGLSYSTFKYSNASISSNQMKPDGKITVTADLTNTGNRQATEVVQLYVTGQNFGIVRPRLELKGFERVALDPKETRTVTLELDASDLHFHNSQLELVLPNGGLYMVSVGGSSESRTKPLKLSISK